MRTPSSTLDAAIDAPVTQPGYFAEFLFASPFRISSRGDTSWNGSDWLGWNFQVEGFTLDSSTSDQNGALIIQDDDNTVASLILNEGLAGRVLTLWSYLTDETETPEDADPVMLFFGVCDDVSADSDNKLRINCIKGTSDLLFCPRKRIIQENGFSVLPAPGTLIRWNGETYTLQGE